MARRFVAGEDTFSAIEAARRLNGEGLKATLNFLGEESRDPEQTQGTVAEYLRSIRKIGEKEIDANISVKLTQLGLSLDQQLCLDNLFLILEEAKKTKNFVRVDMESSAYTQRTLDIVAAASKAGFQVGPVIQSCLRRSQKDVEDLNRLGSRVRLCKGAYKEPPGLAFDQRREVDENYDALAAALLDGGREPAFATHDDRRIAHVIHCAAERKTARGQFEFQMLYGLRRRRWRELAREGHQVRIYVPYGTHWLPYFYRRIRERKENALFVLKGMLSD